MSERLFLRLDDDLLHGPEAKVPAGTLVSIPDAVGFYERIGMARTSDAFSYRRER